MLRIKTKVNQSEIHGIGLFADQFIPKGTTTWQRDPSIDIEFNIDDLPQIPEQLIEKFLWHCYFDYDIKKYILCADDQRFINHSSKNFNIQSSPDCDTSIRDIHPGEELLCNYKDYESDWFDRRGYKEEEFN